MSISALKKAHDEREALLAQLAAADQKATEARRARAGEVATLVEKSDLILRSNSEIMGLIRFAEAQPPSFWQEIGKSGSGSFRRSGGKRPTGDAAAKPSAAPNLEPTPGADHGDAGEARPDGTTALAPGDAESTH